jgi:hypothetical protein
MSQTGQFRQYAEEREPPHRTLVRPWKFSPPVHASEYHLINLATGVSHGGFATLAGARQCARERGLPASDIFHGNVRVEYHDPRHPIA